MENFTPVFTIFKKGTTDTPITIMKNSNEFFDIDKKIAKYLNLGYTAKLINN